VADRLESTGSPTDDWNAERTTFQRVDDLPVGATDPTSAGEFASRADCSENGARRALEQLVEMGIADRSNERRYGIDGTRRPSGGGASERSYGTKLRSRLEEVIEADRNRQERYGVPDPDAVVRDDSIEDHERLHDRWEELTERRTIRRDITRLKRAVQRSGSLADGQARP
jgi:hypothetical protein